MSWISGDASFICFVYGYLLCKMKITMMWSNALLVMRANLPFTFTSVQNTRFFFFLLKTKESRDWPLHSTLVPHSVLKIMWIKLNVNVTTARRSLKNSRLQQVLNPWPRNTGVKLQSTKPWSRIFQIEVQNMIHLYIHIISFIDSFNNSTCCFIAQLDKAPNNITRSRGFKLVESFNSWGFSKQLLALRLQLWALLHKCSSMYD